MSNFIISTIRFSAVIAVALFAFVSDVFAAPILTPATAFSITETSATLSVKATDPNGQNMTVWLEWGTTPNPNIVIGMRDIYESGYTEGYLRENLVPGTTYYFRGVAMSGGATVYTPVASFVTKGSVTTVTNTIVNNTQTINNRVIDTTIETNTTNVKKVAVAKTINTSVAAQKTGVSNAQANTTNAQSAAVIGASGTFPSTLIGWVALLIALLLVVLIGHMIYEQNEKRNQKPDPYAHEKDEV